MCHKAADDYAIFSGAICRGTFLFWRPLTTQLSITHVIIQTDKLDFGITVSAKPRAAGSKLSWRQNECN